MKLLWRTLLAASMPMISGILEGAVLIHLAGEGDYVNSGTSGEDPVWFTDPYPAPGTPMFVPGVMGEAMDFSVGTDGQYAGFLEFTRSANLNLPSLDDFTFEMWVNPQATSGAVFAMGDFDPDVWANWNLVLWVYGSDFFIGTDPYSYDSTWIHDVVAVDQWQHIALVKDGPEYFFYYNGELRASRWVHYDLSGTLRIAAWDPPDYGFGFKGYIDEFKLHDVALTAEEIYAIYANDPPEADAGPNAVVAGAGLLTAVGLDGGGSVDPDGDPLRYEWSIPAGSCAVLDDPFSKTPTGMFPPGATLVTLTVSDGRENASDEVLVTVTCCQSPMGFLRRLRWFHGHFQNPPFGAGSWDDLGDRFRWFPKDRRERRPMR